jgi:hypothetical protein
MKASSSFSRLTRLLGSPESNRCERKTACVLGMARSRLFVVYYFRMYLSLIAAG